MVVLAKNYETTSTFVEVMQKKTVASFFLDTVYNVVYTVRTYTNTALKIL